MSRDPRAVANYLLDKADEKGLELTNLAINKVLYFCHAWYLATKGEPLLLGAFEAWDHGPVVPTVYHQFKSYGRDRITGRATVIDFETGVDVVAKAQFSAEEIEYLEKMLNFYGTRSGSTLRNMSHEPGAPWDVVRVKSDEPGMVIPNSLIEEYFRDRLGQRNSANAH
ncbi:MAG: type II toxin-antitoxin system antitoxin SocA domain-containing protein [Pseudomonadota bacterium]